MTVKIAIEADSTMEVISLLGAIAEAPAATEAIRKQTHTSVTDLAGALKASLPSDLEDFRDDIATAFVSINEINTKLGHIDYKLQVLEGDQVCDHEPLPIIFTEDSNKERKSWPIQTLSSYKGYLSDEDKEAGKKPPKCGYKVNGNFVTVEVFICRHCLQLYAVVTEDEVPFKDQLQTTDPDLDSSCGP